MAYQVVYKKRFTNKLINLLSYLEKEWGHDVAVDFLQKLDDRISSLQQNAYIGAPLATIKDVRGLHVTKHNRLYYKIENERLIILNLYDTRKKKA